MVIRFSDPFETLLNLQRNMERSMSSDWFGSSTSSRGSYPPINVFRQDDDYVVIAEVPGVEKGDLNVQIKNKQLRLAGERRIQYDEGKSQHRRERIAGTFDRTINFPVEIDANNVKAEYRDGLLALYLPRAESDKPRAVEIA